ncbi:Cyclic nucleotide-gated cation channel alpha-3, partial [Frankliniella fusca]
ETVDTGDDGEGGSCSSSGGGGRSENSRRRRRRRRQQRLSRTVVNPDENFYFYWLMLLTVCVLYNVWTLIVRQSFPELQDMATGLWFTADGFSDVVFLLDVVVQFRTGYLEQGLMVYDSSKLAGHYMQSRAFLLDLGSLLPLDLLQFNVGINPILRFPRFLKAYRVYHYYYMVESRTVYPNLWRVVNLIHILLVLAHWFGCFYFLLSQHEKFQVSEGPCACDKRERGAASSLALSMPCNAVSVGISLSLSHSFTHLYSRAGGVPLEQ